MEPINKLPEIYRIKMYETEKCGYLFINKSHAASNGTAKRMMLESMCKAYKNEPINTDTYYSYLSKSEEDRKSEKYLMT